MDREGITGESGIELADEEGMLLESLSFEFKIDCVDVVEVVGVFDCCRGCEVGNLHRSLIIPAR